MATECNSTSARRVSAARPPAAAPARRVRCRTRLGTCTAVPAGQDPLNQCTDRASRAAVPTDRATAAARAGNTRPAPRARRPAARPPPRPAGVTCNASRHVHDAGDRCRVRPTCAARARARPPARQRRLPGTDVRVHWHDVRLGDDADREARGRTSSPTSSGSRSTSAHQQRDDRDSAVGPDAPLLVHVRHDAGRRADRRLNFALRPAPAQTSTFSFRRSPVNPARRTPTITIGSVSPPRPAISNPGAPPRSRSQFHKNDWRNYTETNDYSYNAATAFTVTTRVTVYRLGMLVYGTEPP